MRISDWSSDVCSSDLKNHQQGKRNVKADDYLRFMPKCRRLGRVQVHRDDCEKRSHQSAHADQPFRITCQQHISRPTAPPRDRILTTAAVLLAKVRPYTKTPHGPPLTPPL